VVLGGFWGGLEIYAHANIGLNDYSYIKRYRISGIKLSTAFGKNKIKDNAIFSQLHTQLSVYTFASTFGISINQRQRLYIY
jgi:hypothetical protein